MNPPFGAGSLKAKRVFDAAYPRTKNDVYAAFVERGIELLAHKACLVLLRHEQASSCRVSRNGERRLSLGRRRRWSSRILGSGVLTARWSRWLLTAWSESDEGDLHSSLLEADRKTAGFAALVKGDGLKSVSWDIEPRNVLGDVQWVPICVLDRDRDTCVPKYEFHRSNRDGRIRPVRAGNFDDFRFVRVGRASLPRSLVAADCKGRQYSTFYCDLTGVSGWTILWRELKAFAETRSASDHWSKRIQDQRTWYFRLA